MTRSQIFPDGTEKRWKMKNCFLCAIVAGAASQTKHILASDICGSKSLYVMTAQKNAPLKIM